MGKVEEIVCPKKTATLPLPLSQPLSSNQASEPASILMADDSIVKTQGSTCGPSSSISSSSLSSLFPPLSSSDIDIDIDIVADSNSDSDSDSAFLKEDLKIYDGKYVCAFLSVCTSSIILQAIVDLLIMCTKLNIPLFQLHFPSHHLSWATQFHHILFSFYNLFISFLLIFSCTILHHIEVYIIVFYIIARYCN